MAQLNRKERERIRHRREILRAAERMFSSRGFHHTTVNDIAQAAEFGVGTIYQHFSSKDDLYFSLIEDKINELDTLIRSKVNQKKDPREKIEILISSELVYFERNRGFFRIYTTEESRFEKDMRSELSSRLLEKYQAYLQFVAEIVKEGIRQGKFKKMDPFKVAIALVGMINDFIYYGIQFESSGKLQNYAQTIYNILTKGILK